MQHFALEREVVTLFGAAQDSGSFRAYDLYSNVVELKGLILGSCNGHDFGVGDFELTHTRLVETRTEDGTLFRLLANTYGKLDWKDICLSTYFPMMRPRGDQKCGVQKASEFAGTPVF